MAGSEFDIGQLTESQQTALQTYTSVTDQNPLEAIPLLERSQWNVQIAIAKFFDGEGPDPVAEAQAALNASPPPTSSRQAQNLQHDLLSAAHRAPNRQAADPVSRINPQPENQPPYRPPLLFSILFFPFNLLYRAVTGSLGFLGGIFPFLPRLLSVFAAGNSVQGRRNTSGRRALNPKDTAARFIREFEEEYGSNSLPFVESGFNQALDTAKKELKYLMVVLISPEHDDTSSWVRETLLSPEVTEFLNNHRSELLLWAGNVQDSEAYQVADTLRCTKFPFAALVVHTPDVSSTAMSAVARATGPMPPAAFVAKLATAITQNNEALNRIRSTRAEQQASRNLREAQDSAYERSLAQDRERARKKREEQEAAARAEKEALEREAAVENRARKYEEWKRWRAQSLPPEPAASQTDTVRVSIRLQSGERVIRRFASSADIDELYAFVECYDVLKGAGDTPSQPVQEPDGFEHKYGFRMVSPMPRTVYEVADGGSVGERIGRNGNLIVEPITEEESDVEG